MEMETLIRQIVREEIKSIVQENIEVHKEPLILDENAYRIYDELSKLPNDETVRSAYNMSKQTTERLKKYANERRLPLQDLVELAVINLLDQYEKK
jgi:hypothetical protein